MEEELKEKIIVLQKLLKSRKNQAFSFFEKLVGQMEEGKVQNVVDAIITSYSITQYANFNHEEEELLSSIWEIANNIRKG